MSESLRPPPERSRLSSWVQVAEIVASVGVFITLIVLIGQVRENTAVVRFGAFQQSIDGIDRWRALVASDAELSSLLGAYLAEDVEGWSDVERRRFTLVMNNLFGAYENAYYARESGFLSEVQWARFETGACGHLDRLRRADLMEEPPFVTEEFRVLLREVCG